MLFFQFSYFYLKKEMIRVDASYGIDIDNIENIYDITFKTLTQAIKISKTCDNILLMPGTYEPPEIKSRTNHFELKIIGSGNNTVSSQTSFEGFFNFSYENLKLDNILIKSTSSNFSFKDVSFISLCTMQLETYHDNKSEDHRTHIIFDRCVFNHNFQIIIENGSYVLSFKSCTIKGKIPLVYAKRGDITIKISNTDFEYPILSNKDCIAEIQHISCNFNCPIYKGKETLVYTKDNILSISPLQERGRSISNAVFIEKGIRSYDEENEFENYELNGKKSISNNINYQKELYAAIIMDSNEYHELPIHKFTKLVVNKGTNSLKIKLPKEVENGHLLEIFSEGPIIIDTITYNNKYLKLSWIYSYGWWFHQINDVIS